MFAFCSPSGSVVPVGFQQVPYDPEAVACFILH
jgi:hypothetical protein